IYLCSLTVSSDLKVNSGLSNVRLKRFDRADKDSKDLNGRQNGQRPTAAICNGWMKCKYRVLSSLLRLVTVDNTVFKSQPLQIAKRCGQCLYQSNSFKNKNNDTNPKRQKRTVDKDPIPRAMQECGTSCRHTSL